MRFSASEMEDIREALYFRVDVLNEPLETLAEVIRDLEAGRVVAPFTRGAAGVRAARDMYSDMQVRRERLRILAQSIYPSCEGCGDETDGAERCPDCEAAG